MSSTGKQSGPRLGRRQLLQAGVVAGVGGAVVAGLGAVSDDRETITYAVARPEPEAERIEPRTKQVPALWHESLRLAFRSQDRIRDAGLSPLVESFVVPGTYDDPNASIAVTAADDDVGGAIEELVGDVALTLNIADELPPEPDDRESADPYEMWELDPDRIPGGVLCEGSAGAGTLTPALIDAESGSRLFATSNHLYGDDGAKETAHRGEPLSVVHDGDSYRIGEVVRGYPEVDTVMATPVDGYRPASEIERASPSEVVGQYTKAGLADLAARDEPLTKLGAMTDKTSGPIKGIDGVTCYAGEVCKTGQLKWGDEETMTDGDSGSVNFHVDERHPDDYVLVGGINNARTWWPGADFTWGPAGYHLLEEYGLHF